MITWRKPVSWSKFRMALDCPKALELALADTPPSDISPNYYAVLGQCVQKVFEEYFNQRVNLRSQKPATISKIAQLVIESDWYDKMEKTYPFSVSEETLIKRIHEDTQTGFDAMDHAGIVDKMVTSEVPVRSEFRGLRVFAWCDFIINWPNTEIELWDGKNTKHMTADPRQLYWYAMVLMSKGHNISKGGFIYTKQGVSKEIDLSPQRIMEFINTDFVQGRKYFDQLQEGITAFAPTPSKKTCKWCPWRRSCTASHYYQVPAETGSEIVGWKQDAEV